MLGRVLPLRSEAAASTPSGVDAGGWDTDDSLEDECAWMTTHGHDVRYDPPEQSEVNDLHAPPGQRNISRGAATRKSRRDNMRKKLRKAAKKLNSTRAAQTELRRSRRSAERSGEPMDEGSSDDDPAPLPTDDDSAPPPTQATQASLATQIQGPRLQPAESQPDDDAMRDAGAAIEDAAALVASERARLVAAAGDAAAVSAQAAARISERAQRTMAAKAHREARSDFRSCALGVAAVRLVEQYIRECPPDELLPVVQRFWERHESGAFPLCSTTGSPEGDVPTEYVMEYGTVKTVKTVKSSPEAIAWSTAYLELLGEAVSAIYVGQPQQGSPVLARYDKFTPGPEQLSEVDLGQVVDEIPERFLCELVCGLMPPMLTGTDGADRAEQLRLRANSCYLDEMLRDSDQRADGDWSGYNSYARFGTSGNHAPPPHLVALSACGRARCDAHSFAGTRYHDFLCPDPRFLAGRRPEPTLTEEEEIERAREDMREPGLSERMAAKVARRAAADPFLRCHYCEERPRSVRLQPCGHCVYCEHCILSGAYVSLSHRCICCPVPGCHAEVTRVEWSPPGAAWVPLFAPPSGDGMGVESFLSVLAENADADGDRAPEIIGFAESDPRTESDQWHAQEYLRQWRATESLAHEAPRPYPGHYM
jgi:hypothetical protein